jgi:cation:H+ antiporter
MIFLYAAALIAAFIILFKCADFFVDGASGIAVAFNIPKLLVGIFLVGLATTAPEFGVSVQAAFLGHPEIALGNAIGSVIADDGIALALAALVAPAVIFVHCRLLKLAGIFLLAIDFLAYGLARNGTISRLEGTLFISLLFLYFIFMYSKKGTGFLPSEPVSNGNPQAENPEYGSRWAALKKPLLLFLAGIAGVVLTSRIVIWAAINIAEFFTVSETVIGLTIIAIGTSLPEISTCISAARKGEGEIAVGDIIGADILNILWIIGVSAVVKPITVELNIINFSFPFMILVVAVMLGTMRLGCRLDKWKGILLLVLYVVYLIMTIILFT